MSMCRAILVTRGNLVGHIVVGFFYLQTEDRLLGTLSADDANSGNATQKQVHLDSWHSLKNFNECSNRARIFPILCMAFNKAYMMGRKQHK